MLSNKRSVRDLVELCYLKGIKQVVISPGSRNAPLTISFNEHAGFECFSIVDERSAAFFALGLSQKSRIPSALICTSGSAMLNYSPAIVEAYYQHIPLVILTADRPEKWIDQGEGQSMRQKGAFDNFIRGSFEITEPLNRQEIENNIGIICEALSCCTSPTPGPVHINIPMDEPLYDQKSYEEVSVPSLSQEGAVSPQLSEEQWRKLSVIWQQSQRILILTGVMDMSEELNSVLEQISVRDNRVTVLTETTSNLNSSRFIGNIDRNLNVIEVLEKEDFAPDLLIVLGHNIISKKIKYWLRKCDILAHWHIDEWGDFQNTFDHLTHKLRTSPIWTIKKLMNASAVNTSNYQKDWYNLSQKTNIFHDDFLKGCEWSDLKAFQHILGALPSNISLQLSNSTVIRYMQLFPIFGKCMHHSNRGVSGIDGCTSTAAGASWNDSGMTVFITGDIAFGYDANAFWHDHLSPNLRIIVINNGGGGIFRFIEGPATTEQFETFFETPKNGHVQAIAHRYDLPYFTAQDENELRVILPRFLNKDISSKPCVLELFTPRKLNDKVLKDYFNFIQRAFQK